MKKRLTIGIFTLYPFFLSIIYTYLINNSSDFDRLIWFFLVCYILPLCGYIYFIIKRPFNQWILCVGFVLTPVLPFIHDFIHPGWFQYLATALALVYYTIPFVVVSLIIALIITLKDRHKATSRPPS